MKVLQVTSKTESDCLVRATHLTLPGHQPHEGVQLEWGELRLDVQRLAQAPGRPTQDTCRTGGIAQQNRLKYRWFVLL